MENKDNFIKVYANKADTSASFFVNISMYAYIFPLKVYIYIYIFWISIKFAISFC